MPRHAVEEGYGPSDEEESRGEVPDGGPYLAGQVAEVRRVRFVLVFATGGVARVPAPEHHANELQQGFEVRTLAHGQARVAQGAAHGLQVPSPEGAYHPGQGAHEGLVQAQRQAVVEEHQPRTGLHEEVSGVRVGVQDAPAEELVGERVVQEYRDLGRVDARLDQRRAVVDPDPLEVVHHQQALGREAVHGAGDGHIFPVGEGVAQLFHGPGLPREVELQGQGPAQVVGDGAQLHVRLQAPDDVEDGL